MRVNRGCFGIFSSCRVNDIPGLRCTQVFFCWLPRLTTCFLGLQLVDLIPFDLNDFALICRHALSPPGLLEVRIDQVLVPLHALQILLCTTRKCDLVVLGEARVPMRNQVPEHPYCAIKSLTTFWPMVRVAGHQTIKGGDVHQFGQTCHDSSEMGGYLLDQGQNVCL